MIRAIEHRPKLDTTTEVFDSLTLDFDARHRRRLRLKTDRAEDILLDLPHAVAMSDGDGLKLEDGRWLRVKAAPELVAEIRCADARQLVCVAWHLGNRHLPTQIIGDALRIRPDHVIEAMVQGLGADVYHIEAAFQPEGGAYDGHRGHNHHNTGHEHHHHDNFPDHEA